MPQRQLGTCSFVRGLKRLGQREKFTLVHGISAMVCLAGLVFSGFGGRQEPESSSGSSHGHGNVREALCLCFRWVCFRVAAGVRVAIFVSKAHECSSFSRPFFSARPHRSHGFLTGPQYDVLAALRSSCWTE